MNLLSQKNLFEFASTPEGLVNAAVISILILAVILIMLIFKVSLFRLFLDIANILLSLFGKYIGRKEAIYHRDLTIGKIDEKRRRVKFYRFLNDLIIDLGLKQQGATPYEFLFIVAILTAFGTLILCEIIFGNLIIAIFMYPILLVGTICVLYTRANVAHDRRIEAIIEAENIICNNIAGGVLVAVKQSIDVIPTEVRGEFKNYIDNIESKNYHVRTALIELNNNLGSVADDFIKKCIVFETEEEAGIVGMFGDVVEVNNIKMEMRIEMKRRFEEVKQSFIIGAAMIFIFLGGVIGIFEDVRNFYFTTILGQIILAIDLLFLIAEFVYITYLRAKEV